MRYVMVPGIGGSDPEHWQSRWESELADVVRIAPLSWDHPDPDDWRDAIGAAVRPPSVLIAHSLGCLAAPEWLRHDGHGVVAALLVAPPDPGGSEFPSVASGFVICAGPLPVPTTVVASTNDPYGSIAFAENLACHWDGRLVVAGPAGHLNSASGIGDWPRGRTILADIIGRTVPTGAG